MTVKRIKHLLNHDCEHSGFMAEKNLVLNIKNKTRVRKLELIADIIDWIAYYRKEKYDGKIKIRASYDKATQYECGMDRASSGRMQQVYVNFTLTFDKGKFLDIEKIS